MRNREWIAEHVCARTLIVALGNDAGAPQAPSASNNLKLPCRPSSTPRHDPVTHYVGWPSTADSTFSIMLSAFTARPVVELKQRDKSKIESILAYGMAMHKASAQFANVNVR
jgi:hypothetical protein